MAHIRNGFVCVASLILSIYQIKGIMGEKCPSTNLERFLLLPHKRDTSNRLLGYGLDVLGSDECAEICLSYDDCVAFGYNPFTKRCDLKNVKYPNATIETYEQWEYFYLNIENCSLDTIHSSTTSVTAFSTSTQTSSSQPKSISSTSNTFTSTSPTTTSSSTTKTESSKTETRTPYLCPTEVIDRFVSFPMLRDFNSSTQLGDIYAGVSLEHCAALCSSNEACLAFGYSHPLDECVLKRETLPSVGLRYDLYWAYYMHVTVGCRGSNVTIPETTESVNEQPTKQVTEVFQNSSDVQLCPPNILDRFNVYAHVHDPKNRLLGRGIANTSAKSCATFCLDTAGCVGFGHNPSTERCDLKSAIVHFTDLDHHFAWNYYYQNIADCQSSTSSSTSTKVLSSSTITTTSTHSSSLSKTETHVSRFTPTATLVAEVSNTVVPNDEISENSSSGDEIQQRLYAVLGITFGIIICLVILFFMERRRRKQEQRMKTSQQVKIMPMGAFDTFDNEQDFTSDKKLEGLDWDNDVLHVATKARPVLTSDERYEQQEVSKIEKARAVLDHFPSYLEDGKKASLPLNDDALETESLVDSDAPIYDRLQAKSECGSSVTNDTSQEVLMPTYSIPFKVPTRKRGDVHKLSPNHLYDMASSLFRDGNNE
eukprot:m.86715 g.86715  ORF g.86715 m.86715 type:complete len:652 (+) comp13067_c0_seq2:20-1975(+)